MRGSGTLCGFHTYVGADGFRAGDALGAQRAYKYLRTDVYNVIAIFGVITNYL